MNANRSVIVHIMKELSGQGFFLRASPNLWNSEVTVNFDNNNDGTSTYTLKSGQSEITFLIEEGQITKRLYSGESPSGEMNSEERAADAISSQIFALVVEYLLGEDALASEFYLFGHDASFSYLVGYMGYPYYFDRDKGFEITKDFHLTVLRRST